MSIAARVRRFFASTSNRTFIVYPLALILVEFAWHRGEIRVAPWFSPLLAWGYLQYKLVGRYRLARGRGGPGMSVPPEHLVITGPYRYTRNPMYLGHLIFMLGLALTLQSWLGALLLVVHIPWFHARALEDEAQLRPLFGAEYDAYAARVKRWLPWIL